MANINDNIRTKKLYKSGNTTKAYKATCKPQSMEC